MKDLLRFFTTIIFTFLIFTYSGNAQWIKANAPNGIEVSCFAGKGVSLFAGSKANGILLSTDRGLNWSQTNNGLINFNILSLSVKDSDIFAGTNGSGIFLSKDNGSSWKRSDSGLTSNYIFSIAVNGDTTYAGTDSGIFLSSNNGGNWAKADPSFADTIESMAIRGTDFFAGTNNGIYLSNTGGTAWTPIGLTGLHVFNLAISGNKIYAATNDSVYYSTDIGQSWHGTTVDTKVYADSESNILAMIFGYGITLSTNNGQTWNPINGPGYTNNDWIDVAVIKDTNLVIGTRGNGIYVNSITGIIPQYNNIIYNTQDVWLDSNYAAKVSKTIDPIIKLNYGRVSSYEWSIHNKVISTSPAVKIELPTGSWYVDLKLTSNYGIVKKDSVKISVYAAELDAKGSIESAVGQLDDDTYFVTSKGGSVYCFDSAASVKWIIQTGGSIQSTTCISNNNNIYVGSNDTRLYAFDYQGIPKWDKALGGTIVSSPSAVFDSLIYVGISTGRFFALDELGTIKWYLQTGGSITSSPSISDNGNVYFGSNDGKLYALSPTGSKLWTYTTNGPISSSPALGLDSSVVFGSEDGFLYKVSLNGNLLWKFQTGGEIKSSPIIGLDGVIYFGSGDGSFYCLSKTGNKIWQFNAGSAVYSTPALSSKGSIFFGSINGNFYALSSNGIQKWVLRTGNPIIAPTLITNSNLIMVGDTLGKLYVLKIPDDSLLTNLNKNLFLSPVPRINLSYEWGTFKGNNQRTGSRNSAVTGVENKTQKIPKQFSLKQNYPNPFNPATTIDFSVPKNSLVTIKVYDILGREVATLVNEEKVAGNYSLEFNAGKFSSGVYFYRMQAGSYTAVKKLILMK